MKKSPAWFNMSAWWNFDRRTERDEKFKTAWKNLAFSSSLDFRYRFFGENHISVDRVFFDFCWKQKTALWFSGFLDGTGWTARNNIFICFLFVLYMDISDFLFTAQKRIDWPLVLCNRLFACSGHNEYHYKSAATPSECVAPLIKPSRCLYCKYETIRLCSDNVCSR